MQSYVYFAMLAFFITHELDAVKHHEWRFLPLLSSLPERVGEQTFIWAHVPLFAALFLLGADNADSTVAMALSTFSIIHIGLHWLYKKHSKNEFNNLSSWGLILAAGLFGAIHLILAL